MHQRMPELQRLSMMTLPRWTGGRTSVENRIEDGGRKCGGSWSEWFGAEGLLSSTWTARQACHSGQIDGGAQLQHLAGWPDHCPVRPSPDRSPGPSPSVRRPVPPSHAAHADIILVSHLHADHQLVAALSRLRPGHTFLVAPPTRLGGAYGPARGGEFGWTAGGWDSRCRSWCRRSREVGAERRSGMSRPMSWSLPRA